MKLNAREMKKARKDMFYGRITEGQWSRADDIQRIALHHIALLVKSLNEEVATIEEIKDETLREHQ